MSTQYSNDQSQLLNKRGITVYSPYQLQQITGRDKDGRLLTYGTEKPWFYLTVDQRYEIVRLCSPVFGVVTSRMNKMSGLSWAVTKDNEFQDRVVQDLKDLKSIYSEYISSGDLSHLALKANLYKKAIEHLIDLKPDFSNFDGALVRFRRRVENQNKTSCDEVTEWLHQPNNGVTWEENIKKWTFDMLVHGASAEYKDVESGRLQNFDVLPGGSVYRIKANHFNNVNGYVQYVSGVSEGAGIYFDDEIAYSEYMPTSNHSFGMIPLETLINKVSESLLFDKLMSDQADGDKPPEKMLVITNNNPFGSLDATEKLDLPIEMNEQKRIEEKVNQPTKNSIMTFSGNSVQIVDLSRESTMGIQMQRQKDIREDVAFVFNMSNMEINSSGSEGTSGRATSEALADIEQGKGIAPLVKIRESVISRNIIPYRYGFGYKFEFQKTKSEIEERNLDLIMIQTGEMTKNDIREKYGKQGFGPEYDKPDIGQSQTGSNQNNPLFMKGV